MSLKIHLQAEQILNGGRFSRKQRAVFLINKSNNYLSLQKTLSRRDQTIFGLIKVRRSNDSMKAWKVLLKLYFLIWSSEMYRPWRRHCICRVSHKSCCEDWVAFMACYLSIFEKCFIQFDINWNFLYLQYGVDKWLELHPTTWMKI